MEMNSFKIALILSYSITILSCGKSKYHEYQVHDNLFEVLQMYDSILIESNRKADEYIIYSNWKESKICVSSKLKNQKLIYPSLFTIVVDGKKVHFTTGIEDLFHLNSNEEDSFSKKQVKLFTPKNICFEYVNEKYVICSEELDCGEWIVPKATPDIPFKKED